MLRFLPVLVACAVASADPQVQSRPVYSPAAVNGGHLPSRPQYVQGGFAGSAPPPQSPQYSRPHGPPPHQGPPAYAIHSTPRPIPIASPSPIQQQHRPSSSGPARQGAPSGAPPRYHSSGAASGESLYAAQPQYVAPQRNRYPAPGGAQGGGGSKYSTQIKQGGQGPKQQNQLTSEELEYDEEEKEQDKPDRLTLLLQDSKFACAGKKDGYYADESLNCEVFHYCQDGGKHSWMCPNGFAFHQVHLICVPPSSDNICKQSANYHFVNDYLYKPINEKEAHATNTSLKYADRYYPDGYTPGTPLDEMLANYDSSQAQYEPRAPPSYHNQRQQQNHGHHGRVPVQQQQQQQQRPHPHHAPSSGQQQQGNRNVFFSPESINIPLNQRRPQARPQAPIKPQIIPKQYSEEEYEDEY